MATKNIVPRADGEGNIGTFLKQWLKGWFDSLYCSGNLTDGSKTATIVQLITSNNPSEITVLTNKPIPLNEDVALIESVEDTNAKRKLTWANIKATLKTYFDSLYQSINNYATVTVGKISNIANSINFNGTDGTTMTFPSTSGNVYTNQTAINNNNIGCGLSNGLTNVVSQVVVAGTYYYLIDSKLTMPVTYKTGWVVGSRITWSISLSKSNAGTANHIITIYRGINGSNADTKDVNYTLTGTAVIDQLCFDITIVCLTSGANGSYYYSIVPSSILGATATGWGVVKTVVPYGITGTINSVNFTTGSLIFGIGFYVQTGTPTVTVNKIVANAYNIV